MIFLIYKVGLKKLRLEMPKKAVDDWGDITADKRKVEGQAAFETIKLLWEAPPQ